jgi:hypothetical protein
MFASHYFSQPLTKIEKCSFVGLKSDVSPAYTEFQVIPADCGAVVNF